MNRGFASTNGSTTPGPNGSSFEANPPNSSSTPMKACRYGLNCSRVDCHFTHPDRSASASLNSTAAAPPTPPTGGRSSTWFPLQFNMGIEDETNELKIDLNAFSEYDTTTTSVPAESTGNVDSVSEDDGVASKIGEDAQDGKKERKISENTISSTSSQSSTSGVFPLNRKSYKLTAVVCQINNASQKNLVSLIYVGSRYHELRAGERDSKMGQWYIFNDFR